MNTRRTEDELVRALAARYAPPAWAFLPQVRNGTGYTRPTPRTADALAMSLWPSRGLELHGFEVKCDRTDWLRELKDPAKAEDICAFCDRWWVVVTPDVVRDGELPPTWGLLVFNRQGLASKREAPKLEATALDRPMLAAILRRVAESTVPLVAVKPKIDEAREAGQRSGESVCTGVRQDLADLRAFVRAFEEASGVSLSRGWHSGEAIGGAVKYVLEHGADSVRKSLRYTRDSVARVLEAIDRELEVQA